MNPSVLSSVWDTFLFGILFIGLLLIAFFRVDEIFAAPAPPSTRRRGSTMSGIDEGGETDSVRSGRQAVAGTAQWEIEATTWFPPDRVARKRSEPSAEIFSSKGIGSGPRY